MNNKPNKKRSKGMPALGIVCICIGCICALIRISISISMPFSSASVSKTPTFTQAPRHTVSPVRLIEPGEVFEKNCYILFEDLRISYNGEGFDVTNNRSDAVRIYMKVVGVKADGSYDLLQGPAFGGVDETAYQKDLKENGWAIKKRTNFIRPGETLHAQVDIFDFGEDFPAPDIDGDGYYDLIFWMLPNQSEDTISSFGNSPESDIYKLKA